MNDVDVKVDEYSCFPTMIYKFEADLSDYYDDMLEYIKIQPMELDGMIQTKDDLYALETFSPLVEVVRHTIGNILKNLQYDDYKEIEITSMWGNHMQKGRAHPPHTHSNNVFSGVYYLESGAPIQFFDPRPQASVLHPNLEYTTFDNSSMRQFDSQKGIGLIFPSWLQHWVPTTQKDRISISWNIILRGDYGQPNTLQNSSI